MTIVELIYKCSRCSAEFKAPDMGHGDYGEFLLRSRGSGELRYLNALDDEPFLHIRRVIAEEKPSLSKNAASDALHAIYGISVDPDPDGEPFGIDQCPRCPVCRCDKTSFVLAPEPPVQLDIHPQIVTHRKWLTLPHDERVQRICDALDEWVEVSRPHRPQQFYQE